MWLVGAIFITTALKVSPAQSRKRLLDLAWTLLVICLASYRGAISWAIFRLLNQTFQVDDLAFQVTNSFLILFPFHEAIRLHWEADTSGDAIGDIGTMTDGNAANTKDLLYLVSEIIVGGWVFGQFLLELDSPDEWGLLLAFLCRLAVAHFNCKFYSIQ